MQQINYIFSKFQFEFNYRYKYIFINVVAEEAGLSEKIANKKAESEQGDALVTANSNEDPEVQIEEGPGNHV